MIDLPHHVHRVVSRGREYFYYQRNRRTEHEGKRIRLPDDPRSAEFWRKIDQLEGRSDGDTFAALIRAYKASPDYDEKAPDTKRGYDRYLEVIGNAWGAYAVADLDAGDVLELRDAHGDRPATANHIVRTLSMLISWGIPRRYRADNPCLAVPKLKIGEYEPWPDWAIERVREAAPVYLVQVMETALHTGQRQRDCLGIRWADIDEGGVFVRQEKTKKRLWIPLHRDYRAILDGIEKRGPFVHTTDRGAPWTQDGFRTSWGKLVQAKVADIKANRLVFHGLRKSSTVKLAEAGCTDHEIQSITGMSLQTVAHYSKGVDQKRLAKAAIIKLEKRNAE